MNDLISRSSAIFYAISGPVRYMNGERWIKINKVREGIENAPSAQQTTCKYWDNESSFCALHRPSAQPEQRWILCNEEMPPDNTDILLQSCRKTGGLGMTQELKPCPFCGGEAEMCSAVDNKFLGRSWYIRCKKCHSRGSSFYESCKELEPNEEYEAIIGAWKRAIEAWNRRASDG